MSCLRFVFTRLVKMPLLSASNPSPLCPAMPSTAGDNIDSKGCARRLSNYMQHVKGRYKVWLCYEHGLIKHFVSFFLLGRWSFCYSYSKMILTDHRLIIWFDTEFVTCGSQPFCAVVQSLESGVWLVSLVHCSLKLSADKYSSLWLALGCRGPWWHTCSADKVPGPPGL